MGTDPGTMSYLRKLASAQVADGAWLLAVSQLCVIDITILTIDHYNKTFDHKEMGTVENFYLLGPKGIKWNRPDGGMPMVDTDDVPPYVTLARFLLFSRLIKAIRSNDELSYAKVGGPPINWQNIKVFLNGRDIESVVSADAILGTIEFYKRDRFGNIVTDKEKEIIETTKIAGIVKIVPAEKPLTFF